MDFDREWLYEKYVVEAKTTLEVAQEAGCCAEIVRRALHSHNIPLRGNQHLKKRDFCNHDWLYDQYVTQGKPMLAIAKGAGVSETLIHKWIHKLGIPVRDKRDIFTGRDYKPEWVERMSKALTGLLVGDKNPNWKGGITPKNLVLRSSKRMAEWREAVYQKSGYRCAACGSEGDLQAHHIKPFSKYPDSRFDVDNGVALCGKCHRDLHFNRQSSLNGVNCWNPETGISSQAAGMAQEVPPKVQRLTGEEPTNKPDTSAPQVKVA